MIKKNGVVDGKVTSEFLTELELLHPVFISGA